MCLKIDDKLHPHRRIRIAKRPLIVRKDLDERYSHSTRERHYVSPYYPGGKNGTWKCGELHEQELAKKPTISGRSSFVYVGLHSALPDRIQVGDKRLWAVIPAGARFYIGRVRDIVSDKLVVFDDYNKMLSYLGVSSLGAPIKATNPQLYSKLA